MKRNPFLAFLAISLLVLLISKFGLSEEVKLQRAVPAGILQRVYPFSYKENNGSCFIIDVNNLQYIITARHLVPDIKDNDTVRLFIAAAWHNVKVRPIFPKNKKTDIVALTGDKLVAPKMGISLGDNEIFVGQDIYFLGFPFGLATQFNNPSRVRIPFVKKGILSAIDALPDSGHILYLDGHNNPGFSGGPVIFANYKQGERLQIAGVVSGYRNQPTQVLEAEVNETNSSTKQSSKKIIHYVNENTGIVVAFSLTEITQAIEENPIGFPIPESIK